MLLVDARPWTREALARALETAFRVLRFGEAAELAHADVPEGSAVVLLNVTGMGHADSRLSDAFATARSCQPSLPVVALSDSAEADDILGSIEQGLSGYIPISLELRLVIEALRFVAAGGTFVPAEPLMANLYDAHLTVTPATTVVNEAVQRGEAMASLGDYAAARLLYRFAAERGSADAALKLAKTYDTDPLPNGLSLRPDEAQAARWYRAANELRPSIQAEQSNIEAE